MSLSPISVYFHTLKGTALTSRAQDFQTLAELDSTKTVEVTVDIDKADIILVVDLRMKEDRFPGESLLKDPLVKSGSNRLFVYEEDDHPVCVYQGLYVSMPQSRFNNDRQRACCYRKHMNPYVESMRNLAPGQTPSMLASFSGQAGTEVRRYISKFSYPRFSITTTDHLNMFDRSRRSAEAVEHAFKDYLQAGFNSKFILCPRGAGTSSFRLFETLAIGRVPVILADEWVAPEGPDWSTCSIRVSESDVEHLPSILEAAEDRWQQLAENAQCVYKEWFAEDVRLARMLQTCTNLKATKRVSEKLWFTASIPKITWKKLKATWQSLAKSHG